MNRTLRVTGKGKIKIKPDMTRVTMSLSNLCKDYDEALRQSSENSGLLRKVICNLGFDESELKTVNFNVDVQNESYRDRYDNWRNRFMGYKVNHILKIEFDSNNVLLGRLLAMISDSAAKPEFNISFFVKDSESAKNQLLGNAVKDAQAKASVLAEASGVKVGAIRTIDYTWGEIRFESNPIPMMGPAEAPMNEASDLNLDIEPDNLEVSDIVTVEWEIG